MRNDEIGEVGRLLQLAQRLGRTWKQPARYMSEPMIRNFAGRFRPNSLHRPIMVPKKFTSTVQTGMIKSIEVMMASVSAQSAIGL